MKPFQGYPHKDLLSKNNIIIFAPNIHHDKVLRYFQFKLKGYDKTL